MSSSWFSARLSDCRCFNDEKISCSRVWNRLALKSYRETQSKSVEVEPLDPVNVIKLKTLVLTLTTTKIRA